MPLRLTAAAWLLAPAAVLAETVPMFLPNPPVVRATEQEAASVLHQQQRGSIRPSANSPVAAPYPCEPTGQARRDSFIGSSRTTQSRAGRVPSRIGPGHQRRSADRNCTRRSRYPLAS